MEHIIFFFIILGLISLLKALLNLLKFIYYNFLRQPKSLKLHYGSWAVITGATDGIGKSFAFQFARSNLNLILISRNTDKLLAVSQQIKNQYRDIDIRIVTCDLSNKILDDGVTRIKEAIRGLKVGVLVNNAGATYGKAMYFDEVEEKVWKDVVNVNLMGTTVVTRVVLENMVERGSGAVVNVGSGASCIVPSFPLYAVNSATKAYVDHFSRCLYAEYKNKGIDFQCQVPLYVDTKMASVGKSSFFVPSPDTYVHAAMRWIGYEPRCTPYWPHYMLWYLVSLVPEIAFDRWRMHYCINIREKEQLKKAKYKN